jgi:antitoxin (DNA-binding transcriptional repressor) of toxin-antitoxin stability system
VAAIAQRFALYWAHRHLQSPIETVAMPSITLSEAQKNLPEIIASLHPGEELQILQNNTPIARLIPEPKPRRQPRQPGSAIGTLNILADDDEHLQDFTAYMP